MCSMLDGAERHGQAAALEVLVTLTRDLAARRPLADALCAVTRAALDVLPGNHASIRLLDEDGTALCSGARLGAGAIHEPAAFRRGEGLLGWVAEHGQIARVGDAANDPRFDDRPNRGFEVRSIVSVPIRAARRVEGVLTVSAPDEGAFSDRDETIAELLANCAVPLIEVDRLERLSVTDHHTRAFNHRYFVPRLREELERARRTSAPLSLLLMDLDHFKRVNDEHGHAVGDAVLRIVADRVRAAVRRCDVLVRRGGEEFVLLMPATSAIDALGVADRVRTGVGAQPLDIAVRDGAKLRLRQTISIGIATWNGEEGAEELEHRADCAMYGAKRAGRNRVSVAPPQRA